MKKVTKVLVGAVSLVGAALQVPAVQHAVAVALSAHPAIAGVLASITAILALVHDPKQSQQ